MTPTATTIRPGAARLRRRATSLLATTVAAATLTLAGPVGPATAQTGSGEVSPIGSVGGAVAATVTETAAVLRGTEALAFNYQKVEWLIGEPPPTGAQTSPEHMLVPDESDRLRLVEALGSETVLLWCQGVGIIASSTEGTSNDFMASLPDDLMSGCAGTGGGMLVSHDRVAMLLCVDTRVVTSANTNALVEDGTWCPEPTGEAVEAQAAVAPVVFQCPTSDVIASSTQGTSSDLWDSGADRGGMLRCPGTVQQVEGLVASTQGTDPVAGLRSMLRAYGDAAGHEGEPVTLNVVVALLDAAPELAELASVLGHARLAGDLDLEILAGAGRGPHGWVDLDELELRSVLHQLETLAEQLDHWHSRVVGSTHQFVVEIEGVSGTWRTWLDARSTGPRLFDEADALFGKRTGPSEPGAARPGLPREPDSGPGPASTTTPPAPRPTTTTAAPRPTTTVPRPTTTAAPRPPATTTPPRPTTTTPRPTTTVAPERPTTTVAPERPTTTAGR